MALPKMNLELPVIKWNDLKPVLIGVGAVIGFFIWLQFFFLPQYAHLRERGVKLKTVIDDTKVLKVKVAKLDIMQAELDKMAGQYDVRMLSMEPEEQLPELFQEITQAARVAGVRLANVKPEVEVNDLTPNSSGFLEVPIRVEAAGGYHNLGRFIDALESSKALLRMHQIKIEPNSDDLFHHRANIVLWAYLFPGADRSKP